MTIEQRNNIFAKECLTIADIELLLSLSYDAAARLVRDIKRNSDRLHLRGRVHVQDYLEYFNLSTRHYSEEKEEARIAISQTPNNQHKITSAERSSAVELFRAKNYCATDTRQPRSILAQRRKQCTRLHTR